MVILRNKIITIKLARGMLTTPTQYKAERSLTFFILNFLSESIKATVYTIALTHMIEYIECIS